MALFVCIAGLGLGYASGIESKPEAVDFFIFHNSDL